MPQPKKTGSRARPAAARRAAPPTPAGGNGLSAEDFAANLSALRDRLVSSVTLSTERLQDAVDDAVRRGRITRKDAEDLLSTLVAAGRAQTEALLTDVEQLLRRRVGAGRSLPIDDYDDLTAAQVTKRLGGLTPAQLRTVRDHERRHADRRSVLRAIERRLG